MTKAPAILIGLRGSFHWSSWRISPSLSPLCSLTTVPRRSSDQTKLASLDSSEDSLFSPSERTPSLALLPLRKFHLLISKKSSGYLESLNLYLTSWKLRDQSLSDGFEFWFSCVNDSVLLRILVSDWREWERWSGGK